MKERYYFSFLAANLERAIHADVGLDGLKILIFGWTQKRKSFRTTLTLRQHRDGEAWLSPYEAKSLSDYAGYDLTIE